MIAALLPIGVLGLLILALSGKKAKAAPGEAAPPGELASPFAGVPAAVWSKFVKVMARGKETTVTPGQMFGLFLMGIRRLADLGLVANIRRATSRGRTIWMGDWISPYSAQMFLDSSRLQYQTFVKSMVNYAKKYRAIQQQNPALLRLPDGARPTPPTPTPPTPTPPPRRMPTGWLSIGSRGPRVAALQTRLNSVGFNAGKPDGIFGRRTQAAVKAFQSKMGLRPDGIVGKNTIDALGKYTPTPVTPPTVTPPGVTPPPTVAPAGRLLKRGMKGPDVAILQAKLVKLKFAAGPADGIFGRRTEGAVKAFQKSKGLRPDGIVGRNTAAALRASSISGAVAPRGGRPLTLSGFLMLAHLTGFRGAISFLKGRQMPGTLAAV